jgi:DNA-binding beta-propeller fold protein YncE
MGLWLVSPLGWSQSIVARVPLGQGGGSIGINTVTNNVYVANSSGIAVVDGTTYGSTTLQIPPGDGVLPRDYPDAAGQSAIGVNEVTNKVYIAGGNGILVIDGATNSITPVVDPHAYGPWAVAVNPATNKIYVVNSGYDAANGIFYFGNVTVIDGVTNAMTTITDPNATKIGPVAIAVNTATNKIYVADGGNTVTVIDGTTNSTTTVTTGAGFNQASAIAVNPTTNKIYELTQGPYPANGPASKYLVVIDGNANSTSPVSLGSGSGASTLAVNATTNKIYLNGGAPQAFATVVDGATNSMTQIPPPFPNGTTYASQTLSLAVNENTNAVYGANTGFSNFELAGTTIINGVNNATRVVIDSHGAASEAVVVNPRTDQIYLLNDEVLNGSGNAANLTIVNGAAIPSQHTLGVVVIGPWGQTVTSNPSGIDCDFSKPASAASFAVGTVVHLTVSALSDTAVSWSGACSGTGAACDVTMTSDQFVFSTGSQANPVGSSGGSGGGGGGGSIEALTLAALIGSLMAKLLSARQHSMCRLAPADSAHIDVRICHSSGKNLSSSAFAR